RSYGDWSSDVCSSDLAERYATAGAFAEDLNRYLRDEPIQARRPTFMQRGRKWLRRHPAVPVAAALLLVLLAAGSLVSAAFIRAADRKSVVEGRGGGPG